MKDTLGDIISHCDKLVDIVKVTGTESETKISGVDENKTVFIEAVLKHPVSELQGEFGIANMALLKGLLDFAYYQSEKATFTVNRRKIGAAETVESFTFTDGGKGTATFRLVSGEYIPDQATIANIPWDISFTPSKSKIAEFQKLASLYRDVSGTFVTKIEDGSLIFQLGDAETSSLHTASMVIETDIEGTLKGELPWSRDRFLDVLRIAGDGALISITSKGVLGVRVETTFAKYTYYLRADRG